MEHPTRYYSDIQEARIAKEFNGLQTSNSGAGKFNKGDVNISNASLLIECKTSVTEKSSISIKKEWLEKQEKEAWQKRCSNSALAFSFGPNSDDYFIINKKLMKVLVEYLKLQNQ